MKGARLLERAAPLLAELGDVIGNLSDDATLLSGRLRVTAPVVSGRGEIGAALLAFAEAHPKVVVELSLTNALVDLVSDGIDLAFRAGPVVQGADLVAGRISSDPFAIGASRAWVRRELASDRALAMRSKRSPPSSPMSASRGVSFGAIEAAHRGLGMVRAPRACIEEAGLRVLDLQISPRPSRPLCTSFSRPGFACSIFAQIVARPVSSERIFTISSSTLSQITR